MDPYARPRQLSREKEIVHFNDRPLPMEKETVHLNDHPLPREKGIVHLNDIHRPCRMHRGRDTWMASRMRRQVPGSDSGHGCEIGANGDSRAVRQVGI